MEHYENDTGWHSAEHQTKSTGQNLMYLSARSFPLFNSHGMHHKYIISRVHGALREIRRKTVCPVSLDLKTFHQWWVPEDQLNATASHENQAHPVKLTQMQSSRTWSLVQKRFWERSRPSWWRRMRVERTCWRLVLPSWRHRWWWWPGDKTKRLGLRKSISKLIQGWMNSEIVWQCPR